MAALKRAPATPRRPRRSWRQDPEGRRARIVRAAERAFARDGVRRSRVDRIAAAAGVAEGTVYHLFGSKRGLLAEVGRRYGVGMARAAFGPTPQDLGPDDATAVVQRIFDYVDASPGSLGAFLLANDPDEGGPAQDANRAAMLEAIGGRLEEWTAAGRIAVRDTTVAAELLFGLVESGLRDCYLRRGGSGREPYVEELGRLILGYLRG